MSNLLPFKKIFEIVLPILLLCTCVLFRYFLCRWHIVSLNFLNQLWVSFCIHHFCYLMYPHHYWFGNCIIYFWLFICKVFLPTSLSSLLILGISLSTSFSFYSLLDILREFCYSLLSFIHESIYSTNTYWFPIAFCGHFANVGGTVVNNIG